MRTVSIFACHNEFELAYVQRCHLNLNAYFLVRLCGDCVASSTSKIGVSLLANFIMPKFHLFVAGSIHQSHEQ